MVGSFSCDYWTKDARWGSAPKMWHVGFQGEDCKGRCRGWELKKWLTSNCECGHQVFQLYTWGRDCQRNIWKGEALLWFPHLMQLATVQAWFRRAELGRWAHNEMQRGTCKGCFPKAKPKQNLNSIPRSIGSFTLKPRTAIEICVCGRLVVT